MLITLRHPDLSGRSEANPQKDTGIRPELTIMRLLGSFLLAALAFSSPHSACQSLASRTELSVSDWMAQLKDGSVSGNVYRNEDLGFQYEFPRGWNISDKKIQLQEISWGNQFVWGDDLSPKQELESKRCAKTLLFVSKYPEQMHVNYFNPFALLIAADPRCVAGTSFPSSVKDRDSVQRIASHLDVYFKTTSIRPLEPSRIKPFDWGGHIVFETACRFRVTTHGAATTTTQEILTSTLVMSAGKYWVMCMFVGGDDEQLNKLKSTKIFFIPTAEGTTEVRGAGQ